MTIRIILIETTHPGNIGATARAMKNMGLFDLMLVNPRYFPHDDATARASGAEDVLEALPTYKQIVYEQRRLFGQDYLIELDKQTTRAWENFLEVTN